MARLAPLLAAALLASASAAPNASQTAHLNVRGGVKAKAKALAAKAKGPELPPQCQEQLHALRDGAKQQEAAKCEKDNQLPSKVITYLQAGKKSEAENATKTAFEKCAKMTPECAAQIAPGTVQELRFSGVALSDTCKDAVNKAQSDKAAMQEVRKCEKTENIAKGMISALNNDDLEGAVTAAQTGLEKCMKLSSKCAFQVAPVLINQFVVMSSMNAGGMMPVLVRKSIDSAEEAKLVKTSLLHVATEARRLKWLPSPKGVKRGEVFLQKNVYRVSRLVLSLAREE